MVISAAVLIALLWPHGSGMAEVCVDRRNPAGGVIMCEVPMDIAPVVRRQLLERQTAIRQAVQAWNSQARDFSARCGGSGTPELAAQCRSDQEALLAAQRDIETQKLNFNELVRRAQPAGPPPPPPPPPPPAVTTEQTRFRDNPQQWLNERREAVRVAVNDKRNWTDRLLRILTSSQEEQRYATTPLAALGAGDIILVAPVSEQLDLSGAAGSEYTRELDYRYRVITNLLRGRLIDASSQERQPASHALTFLGSINGVRMYLSEQPGGSRILDERAFLREYGARQMYVARPQAVVDGRRLWSAARNTAIRNPRDYGLFGDRAVCSERAGIVVARATGLNLNPDRPGPIDITPGDFFDPQGDVGKHFVITGLRITGVRMER